ncbi:hypothetical protein, partial [Thiolapillus sp.]
MHGFKSAKRIESTIEIIIINPATKYVTLSASNRSRIKARLAGNGKPLSKAATPIRVLFEAPDQLIVQERPPCLRW